MKLLENIFKISDTKFDVEMLTSDDKIARMKSTENHEEMRKNHGNLRVPPLLTTIVP